MIDDTHTALHDWVDASHWHSQLNIHIEMRPLAMAIPFYLCHPIQELLRASRKWVSGGV